MKLCYIEKNWAYFTSQELKSQWGDDWDDAPYEYNAGPPYASRNDDKEKWEITKVAWEGPFRLPNAEHTNSPFSVQDINAGAIAWLRTEKWVEPRVNIPAGTSYEEFKILIKSVGGEVYENAE